MLKNEYMLQGQDTLFTARWNLPKMEAIGGTLTGGDAHQYSSDINDAHEKGALLAYFLPRMWDNPGLQLTFKIPLYAGMKASNGGDSAISHIYISPSSEEGARYFCRTEWGGGWQFPSNNEEGQMWGGFAQPVLLPKLQAAFGPGNVVLAPNSTGPDTSVDAYPTRVADAIQAQKSTPGNWLYLALHSSEDDPDLKPCNTSDFYRAKGCCHMAGKHMSALVHPTKSPFAIKLAATICKHLDKLT